jgi:hypothetical protein
VRTRVRLLTISELTSILVLEGKLIEIENFRLSFHLNTKEKWRRRVEVRGITFILLQGAKRKSAVLRTPRLCCLVFLVKAG